jgi:membrane protease YdiL (CAAX protease family)
MLENSLNNKQSRFYKLRMVVGLLAWVLTGFILASALVALIVWVMTELGVSLEGLSSTVGNTVLAAVVYILSLLIVVGVPWLIRRSTTTKEEIGLTRLPSWMDILMAPAGFVVYFVVSAILTYTVIQLVPGFDTSQVQQTGFENISQRYEYLLAFATLVVLAPIAEEILFRGYLYGKLRKYVPVWVAILATSALFGFVHGQWNVGLDVFALSIILCTLREVTGNIWAGILLHMFKNGIAFYFLFINTTLLDTIIR